MKHITPKDAEAATARARAAWVRADAEAARAARAAWAARADAAAQGATP